MHTVFPLKMPGGALLTRPTLPVGPAKQRRRSVFLLTSGRTSFSYAPVIQPLAARRCIVTLASTSSTPPATARSFCSSSGARRAV